MSRAQGRPGVPDEPGTVLHDDGVLRITRRPAGGLALAGEIDEDSYPALVAALDGIAAGSDEVRLDLAGVCYCDLAGLRAMVRMAGPDGPGIDGDGSGGRRVVMQNVPPQLRNIMEVVGWDALPGLILESPAVACGS